VRAWRQVATRGDTAWRQVATRGDTPLGSARRVAPGCASRRPLETVLEAHGEPPRQPEALLQSPGGRPKVATLRVVCDFAWVSADDADRMRAMNPTRGKLLTSIDLARRYGVSRSTIRGWVTSGVIPPSRARVGLLGTMRWEESEIAAVDARMLGRSQADWDPAFEPPESSRAG